MDSQINSNRTNSAGKDEPRHDYFTLINFSKNKLMSLPSTRIEDTNRDEKERSFIATDRLSVAASCLRDSQGGKINLCREINNNSAKTIDISNFNKQKLVYHNKNFSLFSKNKPAPINLHKKNSTWNLKGSGSTVKKLLGDQIMLNLKNSMNSNCKNSQEKTFFLTHCKSKPLLQKINKPEILNPLKDALNKSTNKFLNKEVKLIVKSNNSPLKIDKKLCLNEGKKDIKSCEMIKFESRKSGEHPQSRNSSNLKRKTTENHQEKMQKNIIQNKHNLKAKPTSLEKYPTKTILPQSKIKLLKNKFDNDYMFLKKILSNKRNNLSERKEKLELISPRINEGEKEVNNGNSCEMLNGEIDEDKMRKIRRARRKAQHVSSYAIIQSQKGAENNSLCDDKNELERKKIKTKLIKKIQRNEMKSIENKTIESYEENKDSGGKKQGKFIGSHNFSTPESLVKFVIRDHKIGEFSSNFEASKKKHEMTEEFFKNLNKKKLKSICKSEGKKNEKMEFSSVKEVNENIIKTISTISESECDLSEYEKQKQREIEKIENGEMNDKIGEMILNLSNEEYENVDLEGNRFLYSQNLKRIIRVRNICKYKMDVEAKNYYFNRLDPSKIKDLKVFKRISKYISTPSYIKSSFKNETINKYKSVCGNYFGVYN